jgi:hypothetical protein
VEERQSAGVKMHGESKDPRLKILSSCFVILLLWTPRVPNSVANPHHYMFRDEKKFGGWPLCNEKLDGWQLHGEGRERGHCTFF